MRASSGIETTYRLNPTMSLLGSAAVVDTTAGDGSADFVAFAGGCEYCRRRLLARRRAVRGQFRNDRDTASMITASGVFRAAAPWTVFVRESACSSPTPTGKRSSCAARGYSARRSVRSPGRCNSCCRWITPSATRIRVDAGGVTPGGVASAPLDATGTPARQPGDAWAGDRLRAYYGPMATRDAMAINLAAGFRIDGAQPIGFDACRASRRRRGRHGDRRRHHLASLAPLHRTAARSLYSRREPPRRFAQNDTRTASYGHGLELELSGVQELLARGRRLPSPVSSTARSRPRTARPEGRSSRSGSSSTRRAWHR